MAPLLALSSAILYGAADFAGGLATRSARTLAVVIWSQASGLVLLALLLPLLPASSPSRADLLWGMAAGLTGGAGVALLYRALAVGVMAVVAPTTAVCAVSIPVLAAVLLGERPGFLAAAGIAVGILSIALVSQQASGETGSPRRAGLGMAIVSGVAIGFFLLTLAQTRSESGMYPLLIARSTSVTIFSLVAAASRQPVRLAQPAISLALGGGAIDMLANALYLLAARIGPLSIAATLSSLYPASTVLLARALLGERLAPVQVAGVGAALVAVVLIVGGTP
jgi:drug/metabolite transporter (DMT)-like permease